MCIMKMRNVSLWRFGHIVTSSYFKRGGEAVVSIVGLHNFLKTFIFPWCYDFYVALKLPCHICFYFFSQKVMSGNNNTRFNQRLSVLLLLPSASTWWEWDSFVMVLFLLKWYVSFQSHIFCNSLTQAVATIWCVMTYINTTLFQAAACASYIGFCNVKEIFKYSLLMPLWSCWTRAQKYIHSMSLVATSTNIFEGNVKIHLFIFWSFGRKRRWPTPWHVVAFKNVISKLANNNIIIII